MEEPTFVVAVQRVIRRVQIEDDLLGRSCVGLQEQIDEQPSIAAGSWPIL